MPELIQCCFCLEFKPKTKEFWNIEHIIPWSFGNSKNSSQAILEYKICICCNQLFGEYIDEPFLKNVETRCIRNKLGMKRRNKKKPELIAGSGVSTFYCTFTSHLFVCLKIAFLTHIKFLSEEFRDKTFEQLRFLLKTLIDEMIMVKPCGIRLEITQTSLAIKYYSQITKSIFNLSQIIDNHIDVTNQSINRSRDGFHSSLIQLMYFSSGLYVLVFLQSLRPFAILVTNEKEKYKIEYGQNSIFVMDINTDEIWVGAEKID